MRYIDWKATAKSMAMMVREHMREDEWRLTIVFDTALPPGAKTPGPPPDVTSAGQVDPDKVPGVQLPKQNPDDFRERFERAVRMAASLANHFILERAEVELISTSDQHNVASGSGQEHLYKILGALATLQPTEPPDDFRAGEPPRRRGWSLRRRRGQKPSEPPNHPENGGRKPNGGIAWRLLDDVPVLRDERRFKVLITSARKGTIPGHVWRSAHVVFMEDL
jgi:uncharacterized protein (DUF58 family)